MSKKTGTLLYNDEKAIFEFCCCYNDQMYPISPGQAFELKIGREWLPTQMENADSWRLAAPGDKAELSGLIIRMEI